jgi:16S rRNA C1402 (ribose-2'-O) methylase RsmI
LSDISPNREDNLESVSIFACKDTKEACVLTDMFYLNRKEAVTQTDTKYCDEQETQDNNY